MKLSVLRSAAHNLADSLSSECSLALGAYELPLWDCVDRIPAREIRFDVLSGEVVPLLETEVLQDIFLHATTAAPDFLRKHGCEPRNVAKIEIVFRRPEPTAAKKIEVFVTVKDSAGRSATDRYVGMPLGRPVTIDSLGRRRTERACQVC